MHRTPIRLVAPALLAVTALALAGCSGEATPSETGDTGDSTIRIVAATNVYADIASTIAGDAAEVTAIIHDSAQDPHEYEATSRDSLAISEADLVIVNGGGYDDFMGTLMDAQDAKATVLDAVELSGLEPEHDDHAEEEGDDHDHGEFNEHVWYNFDAMTKLADAIAEELGKLDSADAATFTANAKEFEDGLAQLSDREAGIAAAYSDAGVAITEPVPLYMLEAAGLKNLTPEEFSEAVEEGTDAPALVLQDVVALVSDGSVAFLAYNEQTVGPQTEQVLAAAKDAGTPVVSFTELLPDGTDYLGWMGDNLDAIEAALG